MSIRVLIVDDSATMRSILAARLSGRPDMQVVGFAGDAAEGRAAIKELEPDVVTLDIEMPGMNGLDFLDKIMTLRPTPVIIVSGLTQAGSDVTARALALGALVFIGAERQDPGAGIAQDVHELGCRQPGVERHDDGAGAVDGQARDHPVPGVRRPDRNVVAGLDAVGDQRGGGPPGLRAEFAEGQPAVLGDQCGLLGKLGADPVQHCRDGGRGDPASGGTPIGGRRH